MKSNCVTRIARAAITITFALWVQLANAVTGAAIGITIHSISVSPTATEGAKMSVTYSYDGKAGEIIGAAVAGSGIDMEHRSSGTMPVGLPAGTNKTALFTVSRPVKLEKMTTDRVAISVYQPGELSTVFKVFAAPVEWGAAKSMAYYDAQPQTIAMDLLSVGDFDELDRLLVYWTEESRVDEQGNWKIDAFYDGISRLFTYHKDRNQVLERIQTWRSSKPKSSAAALAEASYWIQYATFLRGYRAPGQAPDKDTLMVIRQYDGKAEKILLSVKSFAVGVPLWHRLRLMVAITGRQDDKAVNQIFEGAVRAFPLYETLYIDMSNYLVKSGSNPRWAEIIKLADRMDHALVKEYPGAYADLVDHITDDVSDRMTDLFTTRIFSWLRAKDSWKALIARYPTPYNLNRYAVAACQAGDKEAVQTAFGMFGAGIAPSAWRANLPLDLCKSRFMTKN